MDAWGGAWGNSWGVGWGLSDAPSTPARGDDSPARKRRRLRPEDIIALIEAVEAIEAAKQPEPTKKKRKALTRKIVEAVSENLVLTPVFKPVEKFVQQEVARFYQPGTSWAEVQAAVMRVIEAAQAEARRIEQEIEEEDEMILLMVA